MNVRFIGQKTGGWGMKLKQVLAVMLSSVMVLSAAPTEVFAFDDPGFLTDSSGGTADEGSEQLEMPV